VAIPWVYDLVRNLCGLKIVEANLQEEIDKLPKKSGLVLDLGGGTGLHRSQFPEAMKYICLDMDVQKLEGFKLKFPRDIALQGDATCMPLKDGSLDVVLCSMVSHHLPDHLLRQLVSESRRVVKPKGRFILMDQVWPPNRWIGKLFWRYDRGTYPRTSEALQRLIRERYTITVSRHFEVYLVTLVCVGTVPEEGTVPRKSPVKKSIS